MSFTQYVSVRLTFISDSEYDRILSNDVISSNYEALRGFDWNLKLKEVTRTNYFHSTGIVRTQWKDYRVAKILYAGLHGEWCSMRIDVAIWAWKNLERWLPTRHTSSEWPESSWRVSTSVEENAIVMCEDVDCQTIVRIRFHRYILSITNWKW